MTVRRDSPPQPAEVRPFAFPEVRQRRLHTGLTLLWSEYGALPVVTARVLVDAGIAREKVEHSGLAQLVARALDAGTSRRTAEQISWEFELAGAHFTAAAGWDSTSLTVTAPAERIRAALQILAELATDAQFPDAEVVRARHEQLGEILQTRAEPRALASDMAVRFIYGDNSTYGRSPLGRAATLERITAADVRAFFRDRFAAADAALVLTGQVDDGVLDHAVQAFDAWATEPAPTAEYAPGAPPQQTEIHIVDRPGSVQSEIRMGHPGVTRIDPDYFALLVMNAALGGAFTSRLNLNLREQQGWTYGVRSGYAFRRGPGPFTISTAVATDVTAAAVREIVREVELLQRDGPTAEEVSNMRQYYAGLIPLEVQTTQQLAVKLSELFVYNLPVDYFSRYAARILAVTTDDVHRVARQHIHADRFAICIVGDGATIEGPLRELGLGPLHIHQAE